jgi:hypothetical protein
VNDTTFRALTATAAAVCLVLLLGFTPEQATLFAAVAFGR